MQPVVEGLCAISGRGACTDAERRAVLYLHDELRSRGHEAWVEARWARPQRYATVALGCLLAVAGSLLATVSAAAGLAVSSAGGLVLALEAARFVPLFFPRRATQDVLTDVHERGTALVIVAAYDAPRRRRRDGGRRRAARRRRGRQAGRRPLVPTVVLLVGFAAAVDIALSGFSPGANDNASGVAVAVELFDELQRRPATFFRPFVRSATRSSPGSSSQTSTRMPRRSAAARPAAAPVPRPGRVRPPRRRSARSAVPTTAGTAR